MIKIQQQVTFDDVVAGMLAAECFAASKANSYADVPLTAEERYSRLVERGYQFLRFIPQCDWYQADVLTAETLGGIQIIAEESWFGDVQSADRRLARWATLDGLPAEHRSRVRSVVESGIDITRLQRRVTLFARSRGGPFTLLDGNHRMLALAHCLFTRSMRMPPLAVHLGISHGPCRWHGDPVIWEERHSRDGRARSVLRVW